MIKEKFKNIEFLRIIGCIAIVLFHLFKSNRLGGLFMDIDFYQKLNEMTSCGDKAVELFFIISGIFFALTLKPTQDLWSFVKKKLIRLYPAMLFGIITFFFLSLIFHFKFNFRKNIISLFLLDGTLFQLETGQIGSLWYVPALLWTLVFYFYLRKYYRKEDVNLWISLLVIFGYGFILHTQGGRIYQVQTTYYYIFNIGMLRALAGVGLGYLIGEIYNNKCEIIRNIKSINLTIFCSIAELSALSFIIINLILHKPHFSNHILFVIIFGMILFLFLIKKGIFSKMLDFDLWGILAKYSYSIFITHVVILNTLRETIWKHHPELIILHPYINIIVTLFLVFAFGVVTYHFVEKPMNNLLNKK